jgi:hypothetical protein
MEEFKNTLKFIIDKKCIDRASDQSGLDVRIVKELFDADLIGAIDCCTDDRLEFLNIMPNLYGREWLSGSATTELTEDIFEVKPNFFGFGFNVRAFIRRYFRKNT